MRPLLIIALIALPCAAQPALELTRNEVPVYRNAPGSTKYMDQSVTFPHSDWALEGMPIGNGRLGAMVFGDPLKERIQFSENSHEYSTLLSHIARIAQARNLAAPSADVRIYQGKDGAGRFVAPGDDGRPQAARGEAPRRGTDGFEQDCVGDG